MLRASNKIHDGGYLVHSEERSHAEFGIVRYLIEEEEEPLLMAAVGTFLILMDNRFYIGVKVLGIGDIFSTRIAW